MCRRDYSMEQNENVENFEHSRERDVFVCYIIFMMMRSQMIDRRNYHPPEFETLNILTNTMTFPFDASGESIIEMIGVICNVSGKSHVTEVCPCRQMVLVQIATAYVRYSIV
jgi:hypothetical protein